MPKPMNVGTLGSEPVVVAADVDMSQFVRKDELSNSPEVAQTARVTETITQVLTPGPWVQIPLTNGSSDTTAGQRRCEMRLNAGRVELRGQFAVPTTTGYRSGVFKISDPVYQPETEVTQPIAVWEQSVAGRFGYIYIGTDGSATVQPQNEKWNRVSLDGLWWPAKGFTGPTTKESS